MYKLSDNVINYKIDTLIRVNLTMTLYSTYSSQKYFYYLLNSFNYNPLELTMGLLDPCSDYIDNKNFDE